MSAKSFSLLDEREIPEIASLARLYRHERTGAEVLSIVNDDENKVFGIAFTTPPASSNGVAHILEHSVLCGSEKYPLRKPFIEMARGSLKTFLNAMTFPDKTVYPVASQNLKDFYNLVDVYIDAVLHPVLSRETFMQEGWHYEAESADSPFAFKGVVFNEMKGAYSSPETVMREAIYQTLMPDTIYAHSSGGDPERIPDLTYEELVGFHRRYYHPSNARVVFYGDDDPERRLSILDQAFSRFERAEPAPGFALQKPLAGDLRHEGVYAAAPEQGPARDGMLAVNWLLKEPQTFEQSVARSVLAYVLTGNAAAPLKRALTESGFSERVNGSIGGSGRQPVASISVRGIDPENAEKVEALILAELEKLAETGVPDKAVEAALNTLEFQLREQNTGSLPRGIALMFAALGRWLYGHDPLEPLAFEAPLASLKRAIDSNPRFFADMIAADLLSNPHRATVALRADPQLAARQAETESARLKAAKEVMTEAERQQVAEVTATLRRLQQTPEAPEAVATLPRLELDDLPRSGTEIPQEHLSVDSVETLFHDQPTNGIVYLDVGFNLRAIEQRHLAYLPLFGRALTQTGTLGENFASFIQRMGRTTGGVGSQIFVSPVENQSRAATWLFLRGKANPDHAADLMSVISDALLASRLDDKERIRQMVREAKSSLESQLAPAGHQFATLRLSAGLDEAGWLGERLNGVSQLLFLRDLEKRIDEDWTDITEALMSIRRALFRRDNALLSVTTTGEIWPTLHDGLVGLVAALPESAAQPTDWARDRLPEAEGLTFPSKVNYVAKGFNLYAHGYKPSGAAAVALQHLNGTYLWDRVRVQGGAYGGFASFGLQSGNFQFASYRDPNLMKTLSIYDEAGDFLRHSASAADMTRSIIGVIGTIDRYMLPDAKGFTALSRHLLNEPPERRQQRREEVLEAGPDDFVALADAMDAARADGRIVVLGAPDQIESVNKDRNGFLSVSKIM